MSIVLKKNLKIIPEQKSYNYTLIVYDTVAPAITTVEHNDDEDDYYSNHFLASYYNTFKSEPTKETKKKPNEGFLLYFVSDCSVEMTLVEEDRTTERWLINVERFKDSKKITSFQCYVDKQDLLGLV